jgi:hypothetical protein
MLPVGTISSSSRESGWTTRSSIFTYIHARTHHHHLKYAPSLLIEGQSAAALHTQIFFAISVQVRAHIHRLPRAVHEKYSRLRQYQVYSKARPAFGRVLHAFADALRMYACRYVRMYAYTHTFVGTCVCDICMWTFACPCVHSYIHIYIC